MNRTNALQYDSRANTTGGDTTQARELDQLARWMDSIFEIPFLKLRFGLDAILGLLPGGGDVGAALVSIYIVSAAHRYGVPRITILRMALNIALDMLIGVIPIAGDLFDAYWKSNQQNVALLRRHLDATASTTPKLRRADRFFVFTIIIALFALLVVVLVLGYLAIEWLVTTIKSGY